MTTAAEAPQAGAAPAWLIWYRRRKGHPWRRVTSLPDEAAARRLYLEIAVALFVSGDWYVGPDGTDPNATPSGHLVRS